MPGAMTPEEIRYHARRIAALRARKQHHPPNDWGDWNPNRRRVYNSSRNAGAGLAAPVDRMFQTRAERGWLPRGGDE